MAGFRLLHSSVDQVDHRKYYVGTGNASAMYTGQAIQTGGTANTAAVVTGDSKYRQGQLGTITVVADGAAGAAPIHGIIVGFDPVGDLSVIRYRVASTARVAHVIIPKHNAVDFILQDDASAVLAEVDVGTNGNIVGNTTGSSVTGEADTKLDATTPAADTAYQLRIVGLNPSIKDNGQFNALGAGAEWIVRIALLQDANAVVGI